MSSLLLSPNPHPVVAMDAGRGCPPQGTHLRVMGADRGALPPVSPPRGPDATPVNSCPPHLCPSQPSWPPRMNFPTASSSPGWVSGGGGWSDNSTPECPPNGAGCHRGGDSTSGCPQEGSGCVTGDRGSGGQGQLPWVTLVGTGVTGEEMADFGGRTLVDPGMSHGTGAAGDRDNPPGCPWQTPVSPPQGRGCC